jgi:hypothetical protein
MRKRHRNTNHDGDHDNPSIASLIWPPSASSATLGRVNGDEEMLSHQMNWKRFHHAAADAANETKER